MSALARNCPQTAVSLDPSPLAEGCSTNNQVSMVSLAKVPNNCTDGQIKARHSGADQLDQSWSQTWPWLAKLVVIFESEAARKPELQWTNVWPVAIRALGKNFLVEDHRISFDQDDLFVTHVTSNFGVPALKRKMCPRVVIEG